jgi:predicted acetyltransferase
MDDIAKIRSSVVAVLGRFRDDRLLTYIAYDEHWPILIRREGEIAGFALIRKSKPNTYVIGEFFIKPDFRRQGTGAAAVDLILRRFKGNWEIPFQNENIVAAIFWRKTIPKLGFEVAEVNPPIIDSPDSVHDIWLTFANTDTF